MDVRRRRLRELLILLSLYLLPSLSYSWGVTTSAADLPTLVATTIRNLAFSLLIVYIADIWGERDQILGRREGIARSLPTVALVAGVLFACAFAVGTATSFFSVRAPETGEVIPRLAELYPAWIWISALILTMASVGLAEELLFRSYLIHRFRLLELSPRAAVVLSAALFSIGHGYQGGAAIVFAFLAGLALGALWLRRGAIFSFALGHALYNIAALLISASGQAIF